MTFEELARKVAGEFRKDMKEVGYETFEDMRRSYDWEWADVKEEVSYLIDEIAKATGDSYLWMADDHTFIQNASGDISWKEFKKLLLANLKTEDDDEEE